MPDSDTDILTKLATTVWGPFGSNGLNGDMKRLRQDIGELYGRDDAMRTDFGARMEAMEERMGDKLDGLYKLTATLIVTILLGAGSIVVTLVVTAK